MELTKENKEKIDSMTYAQLLEHWRSAPLFDPWLSGQTGEYWKDSLHTRMNEAVTNEDIAASKRIRHENDS